ncbi:MAG: FAD-binding oxidoreductase [Deltaproteobacteria bacterium]|nr:FAD-binding oxidoreductase [Deltaproteobacteria bacterium]
MEKNYDAIIIGAGIIGCCVAFELAKKGYKTLNIDKLPAAGYGSTSNSCAIIRLHYSTPDGVAMAREGYFYWVDWANYLGVEDEAGMARYINTGCLVIKTPINKNLKMVMASLDKLGVPYEELGPEEIRERMPILNTKKFFPPKLLGDPAFGKPTGDAIEGAIFVPESGYVTDPQLSTHNVQVAAEANGGEFLFNTEVAGIVKSGNHVSGVKLKDGSEFGAPIVVNVAGPHSYLINRMAGVEEGMNIKTKALRAEVCHVPSPEGFDYEKDGTIISDGDIGCYSRPEVGNHVLIGSEDPECDPREWVDPDDFNRGFTDQWTTQAMREGQRIHGLPIPNKPQGVVDLYDVSTDWIPIYDTSDLPGFYMAVGSSGNQYKNAPVAGVLMAELIEKVEGGHDHDADPVTFVMQHTGWECNIGFFSRLREVNPDSSFSVIG